MQRAKPDYQRVKASYGQHIYAYCNVRTNQVVYSLRHTLKDQRALKQLPDIGANNKPNHLRKDLWQPLYTLSFPEHRGRRKGSHDQGLHAYRKLLEWRKVHETSWEPPEALSRPYSQDQLDKLQERLDARGGSKKETVYDMVKREKKKMRQKIVMDQKAASVADLAAVLMEYELRDITAEDTSVVEAEAERNLERLGQQTVKMARDAENGEMEKLDHRIKELVDASRSARDSRPTFMQKLNNQLLQSRVTRSRLDLSMLTVQAARANRVDKGMSDQLVAVRKAYENLLRAETKVSRTLYKKDDEVVREQFGKTRIAIPLLRNELEETRQSFFHLLNNPPKTIIENGTRNTTPNTDQAIPADARSQRPTAQGIEREDSVAQHSAVEVGTTEEADPVAQGEVTSAVIVERLSRLPAPAPLREHDFGMIKLIQNKKTRESLLASYRRATRPHFTAAGISVTWRNTLDAEYAEAWPQLVQHQGMDTSKTRYTASPGASIQTKPEDMDMGFVTKAAADAGQEASSNPSDAQDPAKASSTDEPVPQQDPSMSTGTEQSLPEQDSPRPMSTKQAPPSPISAEADPKRPLTSN